MILTILCVLVFYPVSVLMGVQCESENDCCEKGTCPDGFMCNQVNEHVCSGAAAYICYICLYVVFVINTYDI